MKGLAWIHALAAAALVGLGLHTGPLAALLAAPLACALGLQVVALQRGPAPTTSRRSVGLGLGALVFGAGLLIAGRPSGLLALAAGIALIACGSRLALADGAAAKPAGEAAAALRDPWLHVAVAADEAIRLAIEIGAALRRGADPVALAAEARVAADRNRDEGWLARPERAYPIPPPLEKPKLSRVELSGFGTAEQLRFASEFEPQDPEIRNAWLAELANRTAHAFLVRRGGAPRPALVFVHGWGLGRGFPDALRLGLPDLARQLDVDLALFVMPLHGARGAGLRPGSAPFEGRPLWTNAAVAQAVWDLRRLAGFLRAGGAPAVGVLGVCLGGYAAAVHASVDEALSCVVAMNAPASLDALFWRQLSTSQAAAARAAGLTPLVLEHAFSRHAPLRMRPRVAHEGRLVIGGSADRIVTPDQVTALWEHWGQPAAHWFPGSHSVWRGRDALRRRLAEHLRATLSPAA